MAHDHHHHHDENYYVEQLVTIGVCGAIGGVAVMLYVQQRVLNLILHPNFHLAVLLGGIALLVLVVIRGLTVWFGAGVAEHAHSHDHDHQHCHDHPHDHDCCHEHHSHDHGHEHVAEPQTSGTVLSLEMASAPGSGHAAEHDHVHSHDHDHGWGPWRYAVLLLPVMLYFLNLPNEGFTNLEKYAGKVDVSDLGSAGAVKDKAYNPEVGFKELETALYSPDLRAHYEGMIVKLKGQFVGGGNDRAFSLVRLKINCCAADAIPLKAVIMIDPESKKTLPGGMQMQWVEVTGQVQFRSQMRGGKEEWVALVLVRPTDEKGKQLEDLVRKIDPEERPFLS